MQAIVMHTMSLRKITFHIIGSTPFTHEGVPSDSFSCCGMKYEAEKPKPSLLKAPCSSNAASATSSSSSTANVKTSFPVCNTFTVQGTQLPHLISMACKERREAVLCSVLSQCGICSSSRMYTTLAQPERITGQYLRLLGQPNTLFASALPKRLRLLGRTGEVSRFVAPSASLPASML